MKFTETKLEGCFIVEPTVHGDERGWFMESYSKKSFLEYGLDYNFVQDNHSYSEKKGVLRGIHLQNAPYAQAKLVRCTEGRILDVAVDLRKDSPTYKQWIGIELSKANKKQLLIPRGFGHAFLTLDDNCEVQYKADNFYNYESDRSILYCDSEIGIEWGISNPILSDKDASAPSLKSSDINFEEEKK